MIVFISCGKRKSNHPCMAKDMYQGDLFKKSLKYAQKIKADKIYILSAKYGLLDTKDWIEPYDLTLNDMSEKKRKEWAYHVCKKFESMGGNYNERAIFLCGDNYRKYLMRKFHNSSAPLAGKAIGKQLAYLKNELK